MRGYVDPPSLIDRSFQIGRERESPTQLSIETHVSRWVVGDDDEGGDPTWCAP